LQSAKPALHEAMEHAEAAQAPVPFATEHACPHAPQFCVLFVRLVVQLPPEQAPYPAGHDTTPHVPPWQKGVPVVDGQTWLHVPQFEASELVAVSQPSATLPLQSPKPAAHVSTQAPAWHIEVAFTVLQAMPQPPQFFMSVWRSVSHPFAATPSQSAKPALHEAIAHAPIAHLLVAFASPQAVLHAPQFCGSVFLSTSHPFEATASQSAKPVAHAAIVQAPLEQADVACASMQAFMHVPQLLTSLWVFTSQPFCVTPSQSE
jgi:hypothetical protein